MPDSYTILWSKDRWDSLRKHKQAGEPLTVLFGGPHQSMPLFRHFGVREGDDLYPVRVAGVVLYVIGHLHVERLLTIEEYMAENPGIYPGYVHGERFAAVYALDAWRMAHPDKVYLAPTCTDEVALGKGLIFPEAVPVPPGILENLRFRSKARERGMKHVVDGRLTGISDLQGGTYRLCPESAAEIAALRPT